MVNWSDPNEIVKDSEVFVKLIYALFGLYVWELFMTLEFELSLITKRRKFRWPLGTYLPLYEFSVIKFSVSIFLPLSLLHLVGFYWIVDIVLGDHTNQLRCEDFFSFPVSLNNNNGNQALYTFNSWTGNMAILCASTSLMVRTIALWEKKLIVMIPLLVICLGHWGLLYRGMFIVKAAWDDVEHTCVVVSTNSSLLRINFFYTMCFDFIILATTSVALFKHSQRTGLWHLLFRDGLIYFLISFSMNAVPAILNVINLNPMMNVIATVPAAAVSAIAACRAVIRLQEFAKPDVYVHTAANVIPSNPRQSLVAPSYNIKPPVYNLTRPEIHVVTEQITRSEFPHSPGRESERTSPSVSDNYDEKNSSQ